MGVEELPVLNEMDIITRRGWCIYLPPISLEVFVMAIGLIEDESCAVLR